MLNKCDTPAAARFRAHLLDALRLKARLESARPDCDLDELTRLVAALEAHLLAFNPATHESTADH